MATNVPAPASSATTCRWLATAEYHLIVTHKVTNSGSDRTQLAKMAKQAKAVLKAEPHEAVAGRGYFNSPEILECHEADVTVKLPKR
jgi:hypothetical protein